MTDRGTKALQFLRENCTMRKLAPEEVEINDMLDAVKRDAPGIFRLGKFTASRKLSNGARVFVRITMPSVKAEKKARSR